MALDAGPDAGSFEPNPVAFHRVTYPVTDAGNASAVKSPDSFCKRAYRWSKAFGRELDIQAQTKAVQTIMIEIRRDSKTSQITPNMIGVLNGLDYGITDIQPKPANSTLLVVVMSVIKPGSVGT